MISPNAAPSEKYFPERDDKPPKKPPENGGMTSGDVLRCIVAGDGLDHDEVFVYIDEKELTLKEFGKLLSTYSGWGMRIMFVPEDELEKEPMIEIGEPKE
jgi:hypothetical protein